MFLTHDSSSVRKSHNAGWKHKTQVQNYYNGIYKILYILKEYK